jgi:signal transduction histidine kinase
MRRLRAAVLLAAASSAVVTVVVATVPGLRFAYHAPALHTALETTASLVAVLAMFLLFLRLRRSGRLDELLLACAFGLLTLSTLVFALLLPILGYTSRTVVVWDARIGTTLGLALLAGAAVAPRRSLAGLGRPVAGAAVGIVSLAGVLVLVVWLARGSLPAAAAATAAPRSTAWPSLDAPAAVLVANAVAAVAAALAAIGFARRAERWGDELVAWLAGGSVFLAFARVNYLLFPTRYTNWVYTGDGFRLLFYVLVLVGAMREIGFYWRSLAEAAVLDERRRIARDLHDGLAQELVYISRNLRSAESLEGERLERVRQAAERAQLEGRRALAALSAPLDEPLEVVLAREVGEVADRFGTTVELDLAAGVRVPPARAECLVRIACEAVGNASRHSGDRRIALSLDRTGASVRLQVRDRGCGFDPDAPSAGFGLVSMRERAKAVGGRLRIDSAPGRGTVVEVAL